MGAVNYIVRNPVGVAGLISPWNLPLYLLTWKIAPALAFGNTVVAKPSEFTSVTAWMLAKVMKKIQLPEGACNIIFGNGPITGSRLTTHPDVSLVSFTGGTLTGQRIAADTAPFCKKLSLELGGKNASIVFSDADLEKCIPASIQSSFANQGEICLCTSRIYIEDEIFETFSSLFVSAAKKRVCGVPSSPKTVMGALVSKQHYDKVASYVQLAIQEGGTVLCGYGLEPPQVPPEYQGGYFFPATVIIGLPNSSRCMQEEIFGPVVCLSRFQGEKEAISLANDSQYGLAACIWSENVGKIHRIAHQLEVGTVWCNCWMLRDLKMPFGGMKHSGIGREGTDDSYEFFTEAKTICVKY
eukprot:Sdes_comp20383_c0_seq10m14284